MGKYLVGWGKIPFLHEQGNKMQYVMSYVGSLIRILSSSGAARTI
jgi:hypothetical protein